MTIKMYIHILKEHVFILYELKINIFIETFDKNIHTKKKIISFRCN